MKTKKDIKNKQLDYLMKRGIKNDKEQLECVKNANDLAIKILENEKCREVLEISDSDMDNTEIDINGNIRYKKTLGNTTKTINNHLNYPDSMSQKYIKAYCIIFDCSVDYLLGFIDLPTHADTDIYKETGLTDDSIAALRLIKSDVDNINLFYNNELETLNFILKNIRKKQKKQKNGIGFTNSILHFIGLYIDSAKIKKESANQIKYKYNNKPYNSLKIGDSINGNTIQDFHILHDNTNIDVNALDKLSVFNTETNQHYALEISGLFETYALNEIQEKLIELSKERKKE